MLWEYCHPGQESRPLRASGRRGSNLQFNMQSATHYLSESQQQLQQQKGSTCFGGSQQQLPPGFCLIWRDLLYPWFRQIRAPVDNSSLGVHAVASGFKSTLPVFYVACGSPV